jgi:hypothetical protein
MKECSIVMLRMEAMKKTQKIRKNISKLLFLKGTGSSVQSMMFNQQS